MTDDDREMGSEHVVLSRPVCPADRACWGYSPLLQQDIDLSLEATEKCQGCLYFRHIDPGHRGCGAEEHRRQAEHERWCQMHAMEGLILLDALIVLHRTSIGTHSSTISSWIDRRTTHMIGVWAAKSEQTDGELLDDVMHIAQAFKENRILPAWYLCIDMWRTNIRGYSADEINAHGEWTEDIAREYCRRITSTLTNMTIPTWHDCFEFEEE